MNSTAFLQSGQRPAAAIFFTASILALLWLQSVPALLAALLGFSLARGVHRKIHRVPQRQGKEVLAASTVGVLTLVVILALAWAASKLLNGESLSGLMLTLAATLQQIKLHLPEAIGAHLPDSVVTLKELLASTLSEHAGAVAGVSKSMLHGLILTIVGWVVGLLASMQNPSNTGQARSVFMQTWMDLWARLGKAFEAVAWAQAKIAALNASLTAVFLLIICPIAGIQLPYAKTMVLVTFLCGLLPVIGNLISNVMVTVIALGVSLPAAVGALSFLVIIHKLEYFIAARIQGNQIGAQAWELLIVLFAFETVFGAAGMVAAPVVYAFIKGELKRVGWITNP